MLCLYHTDADGWCSAAIVNQFTDDENKKFYAITYDDDLPIHLVNKDELVYIVDYSLPPNQWTQLFKITKKVIWIDHHKTAIENKHQPHGLPGLRINGIAACSLTWMFFNHNQHPEKEITKSYDIIKTAPDAVQLIGDFDIWKFEFGEKTRFFQRGLYAKKGHNEPDSELWEILLSNTIDARELADNIISDGSIIDSYLVKSDKSHVKRHARLIYFEGLRIYVVNSQYRTSWLFDSIDPAEYDGLSVFTHNGKNWTISFYTPHDHIDMSIIAKKYKGGGHRNACGCSLDELPFDFTNLVNKD